MKSSLPVLLLSGVWSTSAFVASAEDWSFAWSAGWDSQYVSEGRDNLEEGGLFSADVAGAIGSWEVGGFFAEGDAVDYSERNWWVARSVNLGPVDLTASYSYLEFPDDASHDSEYALEFSGIVLSEFASTLAAVYSKEADGLFFEASVEREYKWNDNVTFIPYALVSVNSGYVSDEPNGLNNWQVGALLSRPIGELVTMDFFANVSFGIAEGVHDIAWFGVRFSR